MSDEEAPFMRRNEVQKLHPVNDRTRARAENAGLFPRRIPLAEKTAGWRRSEINEWFSDPSAWVQRHRAARG
jgi:predicted DNA-binding transcriptional regulator AlpA